MTNNHAAARLAPAILLLLLAAGALGAQDATAVYVEGGVDYRGGSGKLAELDFGAKLKTGDTVITARDGRADLELENKSTITVRPNTVFSIAETEVNGQKQSVLSTAVGAVSFKLNRFTGREPRIRTNSYVAGVRGTEFTVYAGMDGTSLLVVASGAVELEAAGEKVELAPDEAVEVKPGAAPGAKFRWLGKELDFSAWNRGRLDEFLADPVAGIERVEKQLAEYRQELSYLVPAFNKATAEWAAARDELTKIVASGDRPRAEKYRKEVYFPLQEQRILLNLNIRYFALSSLSMRRFVVGSMYMQLKTRTMNKPAGSDFTRFQERYNSLLKQYEDVVVPHLVEADI